jgi:hypothetical protein
MNRTPSTNDSAEIDAAREARIGIVVLTHERRAEAMRTLGHLPCSNDMPIVVVDNASSDGTADVVRASYADVSIVRLAENAGEPPVATPACARAAPATSPSATTTRGGMARVSSTPLPRSTATPASRW